MSKWSERYNALPMEVRTIGKALHCELRIQHLIFEKDRLKKRYLQSCLEIERHIKNCQRTLDEMEKADE